MKYKVGDIVKLRDDLEDYYGGHYYGYSTEELKTDPFKITKADENYYTLDDMYDWFITDEMIEGLWEECRPKLKLIDILNKIANGELKEGTKLKVMDNTYEFTKQYRTDIVPDLVREDYEGERISIFEDFYLTSLLNDEVELIEPNDFGKADKMAEPTECEHEWRKYSIGRLGRTENYRRCKKCGIHEEDIEPTDNTKIEELDINALTWNDLLDYQKLEILFDKLNEVINKVNAQTTVVLSHEKDISNIKNDLNY